MAELSTRYAAALFELALERGMLNEYLEQAVFVRNAMQLDECQKFMEHPHISKMYKCEFFDNVFGKDMHGDLRGFLYLLVNKNRENVILSALEDFISMGDSHNRKTTATVISAAMPEEQQIAALRDMLSKKLNKQVEISVKVDPLLIGGLYIYVDGYLIDRTIKKQLKNFKDSIIRGT